MNSYSVQDIILSARDPILNKMGNTHILMEFTENVAPTRHLLNICWMNDWMWLRKSLEYDKYLHFIKFSEISEQRGCRTSTRQKLFQQWRLKYFLIMKQYWVGVLGDPNQKARPLQSTLSLLCKALVRRPVPSHHYLHALL